MTDNIFDFSKDARIAELEKRLAEWAEAAGRLESQRSLAVKRVAELEREVENLRAALSERGVA
jgi:predicted  nucleic acid-binding Zn-ribbon protein